MLPTIGVPHPWWNPCKYLYKLISLFLKPLHLANGRIVGFPKILLMEVKISSQKNFNWEIIWRKSTKSNNWTLVIN